MKVIHFICKREGARLKGVTFDKETNLFRSGQWDISKQQADELIGGWVYLHPNKASRSEFGGIVHSVESVTDETLSHAQRIVFVLEQRPEGRDQKWRGKEHTMAHSSGLLDGTLPHEKEPTNAPRT